MEVKDCTFQPKTNLKEHLTKVDPNEYYQKNLDWMQKKKAEAIERYEKALQEVIEKSN